jgi:kumamolisin
VSWQANANVPVSVNSDHHQGRGIPDVAGNASPNSGYDLWLYGEALSTLKVTSGPGAGNPFGVVGGTSAVAPLYAALIALINASLNKRVGYLNPTLYGLGSSGVFRDINDGVSNAVSWTNPDGSSGGPSLGYSSDPGWDACTGWGSINGNALLNALTGQVNQAEVPQAAEPQTV